MWLAAKECGLSKIIAFEVDHCPQSYGCLLLTENNEKICYSGDTLPCQNLLNYARNCRVLIHEATFEDSLVKDALLKKHTTAGQAIDLAIKADAKSIILTHFSPRYSKISDVTESILATGTMIAFDHMRVSLKDLEWAPKVVGVYKELINNE